MSVGGSNRINWTNARIAKLVDGRRAGKSCAELAALIGVSASSVKKRLAAMEAAGTVFPRTAERRAPLTADQHQQVVEMMRRGHTQREVAGMLGCSALQVGAAVARAREQGDLPEDEGSTPGFDAVMYPPRPEAAAHGAVRGVPVVPDAAEPVLLADVREGQCRFPLWPHDAGTADPTYGLVCGAPAAPGKPYCPACSAVASAGTRSAVAAARKRARSNPDVQASPEAASVVSGSQPSRADAADAAPRGLFGRAC